MMSAHVAVLGGGSWGATLADHLGRRGCEVSLWEFSADRVRELRDERTLSILPGFSLHRSVQVDQDMGAVLKDAGVVVNVVPSEFTRATFRGVNASGAVAASAWVVNASKGIERGSLKRLSQVIGEEVPLWKDRVVVLSGPSHAEEVSRNIPTAVAAAGPVDLVERAQDLFISDTFRVYASPDILGVELGGALKNVYAVSCGIADGLGLGDNTKAALMTRGLNEMTRLGRAAGALGVTFFGLSGVGDLIVTCTSRHSRNRLLGEKIGRGLSIAQALGEMTMVAEGLPTSESGRALAVKLGLELPILDEVYACLHQGKSAKVSLRDLLQRPVLDEMHYLRDL